MSTEPVADAIEPPRRGRLRYAGRIAAIVAAALFLGLLAYGVLSRPQDTTIDDRLADSQTAPAPGFDLPVLERGALGPALTRRLAPALADGRVSLEDLHGVPVVLNFWASWCVPCRDEAAELEAGWRRARPLGIAYVGLNMQDLTEDARTFAGEVGMDYLTIRDRSNGVARSYGVTGIPETFFIDPAGRVVGHVVGAISLEQLTAGAAAARRGRPVGVQSGGDRRETR